MWLPRSATFSSSSGITPRTYVPLTPSPLDSSPCPETNGAAAITCSFFAAAAATVCQSVNVLSMPVICTCEATPRIRERISLWKPFITESTVMSTVMPSAMPAIDTREMNDMNRLRCRERV